MKDDWEISKDEGLKLVHNLLELHKDCFIFACPNLTFTICNNIGVLMAAHAAIKNQIKYLQENGRDTSNNEIQ